MSSLDNNPLWCEQHGFTETITSAGVGSVPKIRCPFCRAESAEKALEETRRQERKATMALVHMSGKVTGDGPRAILDSIKVAEAELLKEESNARAILDGKGGVRAQQRSQMLDAWIKGQPERTLAEHREELRRLKSSRPTTSEFQNLIWLLEEINERIRAILDAGKGE